MLNFQIDQLPIEVMIAMQQMAEQVTQSQIQYQNNQQQPPQGQVSEQPSAWM